LSCSAFVPGHVTGFFEIHDEAEDIRQRGSRGAGICLSKGVFTIVEVFESDKKSILVFLNEEKDEAPVTRYVVEKIIGNKTYEIKVMSTLELPQGQGLGISGAGALSTSLALSKALGLKLPRNEIICIAHEAEITCHTGLGDVMPQSIGGVVIREMEGCSTFGKIKNIDVEDVEIVLCIIGEEIATKDIITDIEHKERINKYGKKCLQNMIKNPNLQNMIKLSYRFSKDTGLMSNKVENAIKAAREHGMASMAMLGNTLFAVGDTDNLVNTLYEYGEVNICRIDKRGMRSIEDEE
jgi:pantoate kinase